MSNKAVAEIHALAKLVDELDYYEILELRREASAAEIRRGYHATSRRFHPDAHRHLSEEVRASIERIAKRVTEAYSVLRDPRRRKVYDTKLAQGEAGVRIQLVEAQQEAERAELAERGGATPNGRRFFLMAQTDHRAGRLDGAIRNLQMALTFEPHNAFFRSILAAWKSERS